jgi:hypothetical protein
MASMRAKRILLVTAGLMMAGAVFGAVVGALLVVLLGPLAGWWDMPPTGFLVGGARLGAIYGAVLGPLGAWLLMRDVPLGLAVGGTAFGTVLGGVAAFVVDLPGPSLFYAPVAGFTLAALALRVRARRRRRLRAVSSEARLTASRA